MVTLLTYVLILINSVTLVKQFTTQSGQTESFELLKDLHTDTVARFSDQSLDIMVGYADPTR